MSHHHPNHGGLLESEWQKLREQMLDNNLNEIDIAITRLMFFVGARTAISAALRHPLAIPRMAIELRDIARRAAADYPEAVH